MNLAGIGHHARGKTDTRGVRELVTIPFRGEIHPLTPLEHALRLRARIETF
jgi:hypothetical protein